MLLQIGDRVKLKNCADARKYGDEVFTVTSDPWLLAGVEAVKLESAVKKYPWFFTQFLEKA